MICHGNIAMKKPRLLKVTSSVEMLNHARYVNRLSRTWRMIDKVKRFSRDKHVSRRLLLPVNPLRPTRKDNLI